MTIKEHLRKNFILAWPVMLTQAGQILVNVADNVMVGALGGKHDHIQNPEIGKVALGAVSLGNALFFMIMVAAMGFSFAMSPLIAQADAKNNLKRGSAILSHGLVLNMIITVLLITVLLLVSPLMYQMGQPTDVVDAALPYLEIVGYSMIPLMIFQSFRQLSEGLSLTLVVAVATIIANLLNIFFNYGLIFGNFGMPRLEVEGAAYGTLISRILMVFTLLSAMWFHPKSRTYLSMIKFKNFQKVIFRKLIQLGIPTSLQMFFEVGAFAGAAFIVGMAGKDDLAAHQIALNLASISFMLCTGIAIAATVRVGNQLGLRDFHTMKRAGWSAFMMVAAFMTLAGIILILFRHQLPTLYIDNADVIVIAAQLLIVAALFQLSDGIQVVLLGALRGMQDVNIPTVITMFAYFVIAMPLGYYLTIERDMGAMGMWIALGIGLTISAVLLVLRYIYKTNFLIRAKEEKLKLDL
ncbi:MATE family efflux transporter [Weeksellaceae bacterium KMM 9713]|uniref:Multidrug-efflux transporter n=1 Tax=Profundicola chukchiensis TaxID=2961959 RepID=A0A9X4MYG9_9FLAO|nr:MATE family efflux transporter [Profundicola chukchiensis]MDG4945895.1 MATE family efflux transporter [Profundicola chukchiensis]